MRNSACLSFFVVRFRVRNHPAGKNWIQYGSLLDNNDYSVTTGLTGADLLRYWMFRFWNSPIAYVFDHDVPRPDSSGLPPFTLMARWSICKDSKCERRIMSLHKHTVRFLTKVVQNTEVNIGKLFAKYKKTAGAAVAAPAVRADPERRPVEVRRRGRVRARAPRRGGARAPRIAPARGVAALRGAACSARMCECRPKWQYWGVRAALF